MNAASNGLPRARLAGTLLTVCGVVGVVSGIVPFTVNYLRVLGFHWGMSPETWADHGTPGILLALCALGLLLVTSYLALRNRRDRRAIMLCGGLAGSVVTASVHIFVSYP